MGTRSTPTPVEPAFRAANTIGEGPFRCAAGQAPYRIAVEAPALFRPGPATGSEPANCPHGCRSRTACPTAPPPTPGGGCGGSTRTGATTTTGHFPSANPPSPAAAVPISTCVHVTSAVRGLGAEEKRCEPLAGSVFRFRPDVPGLPNHTLPRPHGAAGLASTQNGFPGPDDGI